MNEASSGRLNFIGFLFSALAIMIFAQMVRIQFGPQAEYLRGLSDRHAGNWITVYPARGHIYDRWGSLLAGNETVYEVGINLEAVKDPAGIAYALNLVLGADYERVFTLADQDPSPSVLYSVVVDYVNHKQVSQLNQLKLTLMEIGGKPENMPIQSLAGLDFKPHLTRSYPEGRLAANILGFMGRNGSGYYGVEEQYHELLAGQPHEVWISEDPDRVEDLPNIPPGADLVLTIDREIQEMLEIVLDEAVERNGAEAGTILVLDPKTGEILGIANNPRLNPNRYWEDKEMITGTAPYNRGVSKTYEPGSVFKVLTMAAALDSGLVKPSTVFIDTGMIEVGGREIENWNDEAWGEQDMIGCMQHSLNVCLAWLSTEMGAPVFYDYLQAFGIGHTSGVDLANEVSGRLKVPGDKDWYAVDLGTNSFGQGVSVTPLQMASAASALANDGKIMAPHVLRSLINNGRQYDPPPQLIGTPISAETAHTLTEMLVASLENEASKALVPGYRLAGKTGTAEIPNVLGYSEYLTHTSFVGWGPADDPQFLVYVWLEKPTSSIWGSQVAAPVFSEVVRRLVVLMDIPPDDIRLAATAP